MTLVTLEIELATLEDHIRDVQAELDEARQAADAALARHLLGDPDGEALATSRAVVAWMSDEVNILLNSREILRHRIGVTK